MANMDHWTIAILVVAGYVAVISLVRLMIRYRDQLLERFRAQMTAGKTRKTSEEEPPPSPARKKAA